MAGSEAAELALVRRHGWTGGGDGCGMRKREAQNVVTDKLTKAALGSRSICGTRDQQRCAGAGNRAHARAARAAAEEKDRRVGPRSSRAQRRRESECSSGAPRDGGAQRRGTLRECEEKASAMERWRPRWRGRFGTRGRQSLDSAPPDWKMTLIGVVTAVRATWRPTRQPALRRIGRRLRGESRQSGDFEPAPALTAAALGHAFTVCLLAGTDRRRSRSRDRVRRFRPQ
jgi:hypothetical protein